MEASSKYRLSELIQGIATTRTYVVLVLLAVAVRYWSIISTLNIVRLTIQRYSTRLEFNFSGVGNGLYPNGSIFRLADIKAPLVLNAVYDA